MLTLHWLWVVARSFSYPMPLHVSPPVGFAPEASLEDFSLPLCRPGVEVVQLLGLQGFWQDQVLRGVGG